MLGEKFLHLELRIVGRIDVVFQPVAEHGSARLEAGHIECMVGTGIDDLLDRRAPSTPTGDSARAVLGWCPIVERTYENERGYTRSSTRALAWRVERNSRPKAQIAWIYEQLERPCFRHRQRHPTSLRKPDHTYTARVDKGLVSQEEQRAKGVERAPSNVRGKVFFGGARVINTACFKAINEQGHVAPGYEVIRYGALPPGSNFSLRSVPGTFSPSTLRGTAEGISNSRVL